MRASYGLAFVIVHFPMLALKVFLTVWLWLAVVLWLREHGHDIARIGDAGSDPGAVQPMYIIAGLHSAS